MTSSKRQASGELVSPQQKRPHLDEYNHDKQGNLHSPSQGLAPASGSPAVSQNATVSQGPSGSTPCQPSSPSTSPFVPAHEVVEGAEETNDALFCRIQSGIDYVRRQQRKGAAIKQTTRFKLATISQSPAGDLLRNHAIQVYASATHEVYELGIPRPDWVTAGILSGLHDPQWWVDKTAAEIKAGPHADENDVKCAMAILKGLRTRKNKKKGPTAREKELEWKLREGMRRQERRLRMCDTDSEETEEESEIERQWTGGVDESEESEEEMPARRGVRRMAAKAPRSRARLSVVIEADSDDEEDIPLLKDPRYIQWKSG